jgi:hypothetical protein
MTTFIPWAGLPFIPVPADALCDVQLRSGRIIRSVKARDLLWGRAKREVAANDNLVNPGEIVGYRFEGEAA